MLRATILAGSLILGTAPVFAQWADWPPGPTDAELELMVRTAYTAAKQHAATDKNYFARDEVFAPLREAVASALVGAGFDDIVVPDEPAASLAAALVCVSGDSTELRIATTVFGDGLSLAAATDRRVFAYNYDPHQSATIAVTATRDCAKR